MGFSIVCHGCGNVLYDGNDMIPLYRLRRKIDGRCPSCKRKLAVRPLSISFSEIVEKSKMDTQQYQGQ